MLRGAEGLRTPRTMPMLAAWNQWLRSSGIWPAASASKTNCAVVWRYAAHTGDGSNCSAIWSGYLEHGNSPGKPRIKRLRQERERGYM